MNVKSTKEGKAKVVEELHDKFNRAGAVILTEYTGLNVAKLTEIRNRLRSCGAEYRVVKNTLARRASEGTDVHKIEDHFSGVTGVVISYDDIATPVKILSEYLPKLESFKIRVGVLEGLVLDAAKIKQVASLPSREVLLSRALGSINSPIQGFASRLNSVLSKLAFALSAVKEKKEAGQA